MYLLDKAMVNLGDQIATCESTVIAGIINWQLLDLAVCSQRTVKGFYIGSAVGYHCNYIMYYVHIQAN